jgi:hypothetical protein
MRCQDDLRHPRACCRNSRTEPGNAWYPPIKSSSYRPWLLTMDHVWRWIWPCQKPMALGCHLIIVVPENTRNIAWINSRCPSNFISSEIRHDILVVKVHPQCSWKITHIQYITVHYSTLQYNNKSSLITTKSPLSTIKSPWNHHEIPISSVPMAGRRSFHFHGSGLSGGLRATCGGLCRGAQAPGFIAWLP